MHGNIGIPPLCRMVSMPNGLYAERSHDFGIETIRHSGYFGSLCRILILGSHDAEYTLWVAWLGNKDHVSRGFYCHYWVPAAIVRWSTFYMLNMIIDIIVKMCYTLWRWTTTCKYYLILKHFPVFCVINEYKF